MTHLSPQQQQQPPSAAATARAPAGGGAGAATMRQQNQTINQTPSGPPVKPQPNRQAMPSKSDMTGGGRGPAAAPGGGANVGPAPPIISVPPARHQPDQPSFPDPAMFRQPNTLQICEQVNRGRTPTRQDRANQRINANNNLELAPAAVETSGPAGGAGGSQ